MVSHSHTVLAYFGILFPQSFWPHFAVFLSIFGPLWVAIIGHKGSFGQFGPFSLCRPFWRVTLGHNFGLFPSLFGHKNGPEWLT